MHAYFRSLFKIILFLSIGILPANLLAQEEAEKDSLESLLPSASDIQRADILNGLANCIRSIDTAKACNYARQAYILSEKLNYCRGKATAEVMMGILHKNQSNNVQAKMHYLSGLSLALKCKEPYSVSFAYHSLGNLAYLQGDYGKAMRFYIASVKISEQIGDLARAARTYNNIGALYLHLRNAAKAEVYYLRAIELYKGGKNELIVAEIENNLATIYQDKGFELKALYHYSNALEVFRRKNSLVDISSALNNIGLVYLARKQPKKALPFFRESYQIDLNLKEPGALILILSNLSATYHAIGKMDSALYYVNDGISLAVRYPQLKESAEIYGTAADIYGKLNDKVKQAYYLKMKKESEKDVLNTIQKSDISIVAAEFENERKEQKLKLMMKENEISRLKINEQKSSIERRNIFLLATSIIIFFLLLISGLLIFTFQLNKKNKLFELSSKSQSNMLQQINHEIRTPLNGIVGMSQLALESKTFSELKEYLTYIKLSSDDLLFVLNNLITYLQLDRKEAHSFPAQFDLHEALEELFRKYNFQCKHKGLVFNQMVYPGVPKMIRVDGHKLNTMIQNLLSNAIKHSKAGVIKIEVKQVAYRMDDHKRVSTLQFAISDEGPGLSEKEIKHIFKGSSKVKSIDGGFGIGLKNVKELCDLMKGKIEVKSELGVGSTFFLELEVENMDEEGNRGNGISKNKLMEHSQYRILVVEDDQLNQRLFAKIMEKEGFSYTIAENGLKALSLIKERSYDLILMDIRMPEMDGIETAHNIRTKDEFSIDRNVPIIAVTAHDDAQEKKKCFDVGMNDYLTKPINKSQLLKKMDEQLLSKRI